MDNHRKKVCIVGATGLIGRQLVNTLLDSGYNPVVLSRNPSRVIGLFGGDVHVELWNDKDDSNLVNIIEGAYAVVNLAGESIATRWTSKKKKLILSSRVKTTETIVNAVMKCNNPPKVFVQASAIGYYPYNSNVKYDENGPLGDGFLSKVVMGWEQTSAKVEIISRLVIVRTGVVLSSNGGFLEKIVLPIRLFAGGWFGRGDQMISWIHIEDHVKAIRFLIENDSCNGVYNLVSPDPIQYKQLVKRIGAILNRPIWLPIPRFVLRLIFGDMAKEVILANQNIIPVKIEQAGFKFEYFDIDIVLKNLLRGEKA
jgi:uncharacterized protein